MQIYMIELKKNNENIRSFKKESIEKIGLFQQKAALEFQNHDHILSN